MGEENKGAQSNAAQIEFWNGRVGELWKRNQERLDRAFAAFTPILIGGAAPTRTENLVDVGCGCGELALALAAQMGSSGHVLGIDISKPMLERARARAAALSGAHAALDWLEADATDYHFDADFDLLVSRFGVMFFADPVASFGNLRRALKPGGRFAFLCWSKLDLNPWAAVPVASLSDLCGPQLPADPFAPGPFALADTRRAEAIFTQAGFCDLTVTPIKASVLLGRAESDKASDRQVRAVEDAMELSLRTGPAGALLREADDATKHEARRLMSAALLPYAADGELKLGATCWLYRGRNP
jgi:SAM-dependent methyltransferase